MNVDTALRILRALAVGTNPQTGKIFPPDSLYHHPDVRALWLILSMVKGASDTLPPRPDKPRRAGEPWSPREDVTLRHSFQGRPSIGELAQRHLRTEGGIRSRLEKLGLIEVVRYLDQGGYLHREKLAEREAIFQELNDCDRAYEDTEQVYRVLSARL